MLQDFTRLRSILSSFTTFLLIIGYALEVSKIGLATIESIGQKYLPIYELAPFRILVTEIGVFLAFIFTVFPFPITSRDVLRRDVARQFHLLSNLYSLTRTKIGMKVDTAGEASSTRLEKLMEKEFFKIIALSGVCAQNLAFTSWEPSLKYKFPKEVYADLLKSVNAYRPPLY
jgi:hypothetical protein